ncbi:MAG: TldD/PmbA family protein [Acidobacteria bacterium]|nr:TldD/PmbA family protein [Acidobacteriota bacterium]
MLSEAECREIAERVVRSSAADETEVFLHAGQGALTRFANNVIHQNVAEEGIQVSVRVVVDSRTARATTNKNDQESLRRTIEQALACARWQPKDPDLLPMLGPQRYTPVNRVAKATVKLTPEMRAEAVRRVVERAEQSDLAAAGVYANNYGVQALANSRGLFAYHEETRAEFSLTCLKDSASGWAKANYVSADELGIEALAERACQKALASQEPKELAPGHYTVILEPAAVLDLVGFLFYDFAATALSDQRSCFTGRLSQKVFGENISLWDDVYHPLQTGSAWDGEGVPRKKIALVDRGILRNLVYGRQAAQKAGTEPTGHGLLLPNEYGEAPMNLVFAGGESSVEEMIQSTERGVLVTRLWYIREVDPYEKILTGMTRDATFYVADGKIQYPIRNLRFNQSIIEMLSQVELLGPAVRAAGEESFEMVVPAMKVSRFHFTEVTKY